ncbi:sigma-70 family RNA polymerase sigma factor [Nodosilinea sp. PGN35]|uniref:sigma-70 family RNA polymerase sigma factor n=1 Tax=Nodosilinea sp. PGN35 TaxID=3020489 RepID=UPI0023B22BCA|nr:sigma-70 family RNA polymerase sigma factor [Nodosilinea sp. TSF1-S3]MDF0368336.1 sigma-70 family RNA polymerase sigma factor [Nodosilinea sp. TSF1-S3]
MSPLPPPDPQPPSPVSDRDLVTRLWAGDTAALATLYDRYAPMVYTLALKMLSNPTEAEDLTQEVFVNFWQRRQYDPERGSMGSYLATYTRSRALDRLRMSSGRAAILQRFQRISEASARSPNPVDYVAQHEQHQHLRAALAQLPPTEREALEIAYFQGLTQAEIAAQLGIPLGTVKSRCRQGLRRLRTLLQPHKD